MASARTLRRRRQRTRKKERENDEGAAAHGADQQEALPGLPDHVVVTHVFRFLSSKPIDLARLRAVSRPLRDAVDTTGREIKGFTAEEAAQLGYLSTVQHKLRGKRYNMGEKLHKPITGFLYWKVIDCAVKGGHVNTVKWLRIKGCTLTGHMSLGAVQHGYVEVLKYLCVKGCPWDATTCAFAADEGQFELLKWAHDNGCPWSEGTGIKTVKGEHVELMTLAVENGCPVPTGTIDSIFGFDEEDEFDE